MLDGLLGFDLHGKSVGIFGFGAIGSVVARILHGFGRRIFVCDPFINSKDVPEYADLVDKTALLRAADIVSLHCPLTPETYHLIDAEAISRTRDRVMLINTSRGGLIDTKAVISALKVGHIGYLGLDANRKYKPPFLSSGFGRIGSGVLQSGC